MTAAAPRPPSFTLWSMLGTWFTQHLQAAGDTLRQLAGAPVATLLTVAALAIALALPAGLYILTENLKRLGGNWEGTAAISLFLNHTLDERQAEELAQSVRARSDVASVRVISRQEGLEEFRRYSGLGGALDHLSDNPLPVVLAIMPSRFLDTAAELEQLVAALERLPGVDFARFDGEWAQRLRAIVTLLEDLLRLLALALALGVLLGIGNTIRLEIEHRRAEIEVMSLVGATAAFIRRPFLYLGLWYGGGGGLLAWLLTYGATLFLQTSAARLAQQYHSTFVIVPLSFPAAALLVGSGCMLGVLGSWLAVARHLGRLAPPRDRS